MFHSLLLSREQQNTQYMLSLCRQMWAILLSLFLCYEPMMDNMRTVNSGSLADIHTLVKALSGHIPMLVLYAMFITKKLIYL